MSEKIAVGSIVEGKVVRIKPFGAIVSLPDNTQGLVHISHISTNFVQNIEEYVAIGDVVKVKVISSDPATGKISLSMKEALPPVAKNPNEASHPSAHHDYSRSRPSADSGTFEDKFKDWLKASNERQAGLNKRNKRR